MPPSPLEDVLRYLRRSLGAQAARDVADGELLARFVDVKDESAAAVLVERYGPMVFGVCRRVLGDVHDAEDAFQATFLVLARRAGALHRRQSLAGWLYAVAQRVALKARARANLRQMREKGATTMRRAEASDDPSLGELRSVLDEEIARLPEKYRTPLVLCYFQGKHYSEAARELGLAKSSLGDRVARGRELLRHRLVRRGITLSVGSLTATLTDNAAASALPALLSAKTLKAIGLLAAGKSLATACVSATALALAEETMVAIKSKLLLAVLLFSLALGGAGWAGYGLLLGSGQAEERAVTQEKPVKPPENKEVSKLVDIYGDPLPEGVLARLGTERFRHSHRSADLPTAFSPDGKTVVTVGDRIMKRWDTSTGKLIRRFPGDSHVIVLYAPNGKWIAEHGQLLDPISGNVAQQLPKGATPLAFSRDGAILVIGEQDGSLILWDTALGKFRTRLGGLKENVSAAAFAADDRTLITLTFGREMEARHWDVAKGTLIRSIKLPERGHTLRLSPDGKIMATCNRQEVSLWDTTTGQQCGVLAVEGMAPQYGLAFSEDSRTLATDWSDRQSRDAQICIWDVASRKLRRRFPIPSRAIGFLHYSPSDRILASSGPGEPLLRLWDTTTGQLFLSHPAHNSSVSTLAFSLDGSALISGALDHNLRVWDAANGRHIRELPAYAWGVSAAAVTPDGQALISGQGTEVLLQDWRSGKEIRRLDLGPKEQLSNVSYVGLSPDGRTGVSLIGQLGGGSRIHLWDLTTGKVQKERVVAEGSHQFVALSPDARLLAAYVDTLGPAKPSKNPVEKKRDTEVVATQLVLQDVSTGRTRLSILLPDTPPHRAAFSPDSRTLMTSSFKVRTGEKGSHISDHRLHLWELVTGLERLTIRSPDEGSLAGYSTFTFSPDGRTLAAARHDQTIRFFGLATGAELLTRSGFDTEAYRLAFRPDGKALASGHRDSTILMWDLSKLAGKLSIPPPLTEAELARAWADLASANARKAYAAILALAATPDRAVPYLGARLNPAAAPPAETLRKLLADLDSERYQLRQAAFKELSDLGETAEAALEEALKADPSLEKRRRIEQLLAAPHIVRDPNLLRALRSLEVLERIGSVSARDVLKTIANGAPEARLTRAARASLRR